MSNIKSLSPNAQEFIPTLHVNHVVVANSPSMTRTQTHENWPSSRQYPQQQQLLQQVASNYMGQEYLSPFPASISQPAQVASPTNSFSKSSSPANVQNNQLLQPFPVQQQQQPLQSHQMPMSLQTSYGQRGYFDYNSNPTVNGISQPHHHQHHQHHHQQAVAFNGNYKSLNQPFGFSNQKPSNKANHQRKKSGDLCAKYNNSYNSAANVQYNAKSNRFGGNSQDKANQRPRADSMTNKEVAFEMTSSYKEWPTLSERVLATVPVAGDEPKTAIAATTTKRQNYSAIAGIAERKTKAVSEPTGDGDGDGDECEVDSEEVVAATAVEPYVVDGSTLKKLMDGMNVSFLKKTVEQHYLNANSEENGHYKQFSFKEAVLSKPTTSAASKANQKPSAVAAVSAQDNSNEEKGTDEPEEAAKKSKSQKRASRRKRSRSKHSGRAAEEATSGQTKASDLDRDVTAKSRDRAFMLSSEDFPNLDTNDKDKLTLQESLKATPVENSRAASVGRSEVQRNETTAKEAPANQAKTSQGKKFNRPIVFEFANIVSALEKSQKDETGRRQHTGHNKSHHLSGTNLSGNGATSISSKRSQSQHSAAAVSGTGKSTNPLDSCPTLLRGKEREMPRQKRHSTLKKIILRERGEKQMQKRQLSSSVENNPTELYEQVEAKLTDCEDTNRSSGCGEGEKAVAAVGPGEPADTDEAEGEGTLALEDSDGSEGYGQGEEVENESGRDNETDGAGEETSHQDEDEESERDSDKSVSVHDVTDGQDSPCNVTDQEEPDAEIESEAVDGEAEENNENENENENQQSPISQGSPISIGDYTPTRTSTEVSEALSQLANNRALISLEKLEEQVKQKVHNRKFREYCNQIVNREIDVVCFLLLREIVRFQDRMYHKNPAKAKSKRRYVMGIREVTKHLKLGKLKCVILAPNCEKIQAKGGLDDAINTIIQHSMEQSVPFLFALGRKSLGKALNKLVPISVVGIFDYAGAEEHFRRLVSLANNAKLAYQEMIEEYEKEECESLIGQKHSQLDPTRPVSQQEQQLQAGLALSSSRQHHQINANILMVPSHYGHSRNSSNGSNISVDPCHMYPHFQHSSHANINYQHPQPHQHQHQHQHQHNSHQSHSRSASGNFSFSKPSGAGHSRSASSGGGVPLAGFNSVDLGQAFHGGMTAGKQHWTHSRTPSNCSNISFISRLSEPISEVGSFSTLLIPDSVAQYNLMPGPINYNMMSSATAPQQQPQPHTTQMNAGLLNNAVHYYSERVRQEMREPNSDSRKQELGEADYQLAVPHQPQSSAPDQPLQQVPGQQTPQQTSATPLQHQQQQQQGSLVNLHLGCINEIDQGNEADTEANEPFSGKPPKQQKNKQQPAKETVN